MEICVRGCCLSVGEKLTPYCDDNSCSVIEMHTFLVTLIRQFEFALPEDAPKIRRQRPGFVIPVVVGEEHKGPQLPLKVTPLKDK